MSYEIKKKKKGPQWKGTEERPMRLIRPSARAKSKLDQTEYKQNLHNRKYISRPELEATIQKYDELWREIVQKGTEEEKLGAWEYTFGTQGGDNWVSSPYIGRSYPRAQMAIDKISLILAKSSLTEWSSLLDAWFAVGFSSTRVESIVRQGWRTWAQKIQTKDHYQQAVKGLTELKAWVALEEVLGHAPYLEPELILKAHELDREEAIRGFLSRTDIETSLGWPLIEKIFKDWKSETFCPEAPSETKEIALNKKWHTPEFFELVIKRSREITLKRDSRWDKSIPSFVDMAKQLKGAPIEFWEQLIKVTEAREDFFTSLLANCPIPLSLLRGKASSQVSARIKIAIAKNAKVKIDQKTRQILEQSGQDASVWKELLRTSKNIEEAGRLVGYLGTKNPKGIAKYLNKTNFAEPLPLPKSMVAQAIMSQTDKEGRVAVIKALPKIKPEDREAPVMPKRAKLKP